MRKSFCSTISQIRWSYRTQLLRSVSFNLCLSSSTKDIWSSIKLDLFLRPSTFRPSQNSWNAKNKFFKKESKLSTSINFWALFPTTTQRIYWKVSNKNWTKNHIIQNKTGKLFGDRILSAKFSTFSKKSTGSSLLKEKLMSQTIWKKSLLSSMCFSTRLWDKKSSEKALKAT